MFREINCVLIEVEGYCWTEIMEARILQIRELVLKNFRGFDELILKLDGRTVVLAGTNGAGKSSILNAAGILLSYLVEALSNGTAKGITLRELDIKNGKDMASLRAKINFNRIEREIEISRKRSEINGDSKPEVKDQLEDIIRFLQAGIKDNEHFSIPVFVHYPVHRFVIDVPLELNNGNGTDRLSAYHNGFLKGVNFSYFFKWFKNQEDRETQVRVKGNKEYKDRCLNAVREAIYKFMPGFSDLKTVHNGQVRMLITKWNQLLDMSQLSDGEKCIIALIGDLARRLTLANPGLDNPLEGQGIVLIDEIELHLHPAMEREIVNRLEETFPNIQFILSTHSPQVLGEIKSAEVFFVSQNYGDEIHVRKAPALFGKDSNMILEQFMGAAEKNAEIKALQRHLFKLLMDSELIEAKNLLDDLVEILGSQDPSLIKADLILRRKESLKK